jgi:hypothetical protein
MTPRAVMTEVAGDMVWICRLLEVRLVALVAIVVL